MSSPLREVTTLFLRLGLTAFGGPAAHLALMHEQVVRRRRWLDDARFLDLVGLANLVPGPNSTELAIHLGRERAGWRGFAAAGVAFIAPAMLIVLGLAWLYGRYGALPQAASLLEGVKAVMIAIIAQALWTLVPKAVKGPLTGVVGAAALALALAGVHEIALLFGAGLLVLGWRAGRHGTATAMFALPVAALRAGAPGTASAAAATVAAATAAVAVPFNLPLLFLSFLKIGAVMYGSGYVLLAFLRAEFVTRFGWLTEQQVLDAVAVGQITPGPLFTAATFIGRLLGGVPGALLATLGIFLPSFVFVALTGPLLRGRERSPLLGAFLDGVNVAALGLMAAVTWQLGRSVLVDMPVALVTVISLVLLVRTRIPSLGLLAGGAVFGLARAYLPG
ncbi:MAG: chromate efflux transporter [bacterium]|nr:chromate efflux transporter [bacterium]